MPSWARQNAVSSSFVALVELERFIGSALLIPALIPANLINAAAPLARVVDDILRLSDANKSLQRVIHEANAR